MLLHGGGSGRLTAAPPPRAACASWWPTRGPGSNFLNWIEPPAEGGQASMGYGFKIIVDNLDARGPAYRSHRHHPYT